MQQNGSTETIKHGAVMATQGENHGEIRVELIRDVDADSMLEIEVEEEELAQ